MKLIGECVITMNEILQPYPIKAIIVDALQKAGLPVANRIQDACYGSYDEKDDMKRINDALRDVGATEIVWMEDRFKNTQTYRWYA